MVLVDENNLLKQSCWAPQIYTLFCNRKFRKIAVGGPQPQVCKFTAPLRQFFALPQTQMTFYFRKLKSQTLLLFCPGLINRGDLEQ